jgi:hypothetical protein
MTWDAFLRSQVTVGERRASTSMETGSPALRGEPNSRDLTGIQGFVLTTTS